MDAKKKKKIKAKQPKVVQLDYPIPWSVDGETVDVTEVVIRPLKGRDIKNLSASPKFNELVSIAVNASDFPKSFFDDLDSSDLLKVVEAVGDLL